MLVRPRGVSTSLMNDAEYRVRADEVPGVNRLAHPVTLQACGVDGFDSAVGQRCVRRAPIQFGLIEIDTLFVFGSGAGGSCPRSAGSAGHAVSGGILRRIQRAVVRHIVESAY